MADNNNDFTVVRDGRIDDVVEHVHASDRLGQSRNAPVSDTSRGIAAETGHASFGNRLLTGHIVFALPNLNWYRVQMDGTGAVIPCFSLIECGGTPLGPRPTGTTPPRTSVVIHLDPVRQQGMIIGIIPPLLADMYAAAPDVIHQASGAGLSREKVYNAVFTQFREGGTQHRGANRPLDSTSLEWGRICETGTMIHLDPFLITLRVNELCGLWLHYHDDFLRMAAWNHDCFTATHSLAIRHDEGENHLIEEHYVYPWEGSGLYGAPGTNLTTAFDPKEVQYSGEKSYVDLPDGAEDLKPIPRYTRYGGYLGQGEHQLVSVPGKSSGQRKASDDPTQSPDIGVFEEFTGLDGTHAVRSAKQLIRMKYSLIPVPFQKLPPEDPTGDDATTNNYRFSSQFGHGPPHKVSDIKITAPTDARQLLRAAGILDFLAYAFNWQGLHPFYYHTKDFAVIDESKLAGATALGPAQEKLNFQTLTSQSNLPDATAQSINVDQRYGAVTYTQRISYDVMAEDGSLIRGDGSGCEELMIGGTTKYTMPGDFVVQAGRRIILMADDIIFRSRKSVDISGGTGDVHIKAEKNLQLLSNSGGVLVQSNTPFAGQYTSAGGAALVGENVISGGIVFKSPSVISWASQIYLRTGGGPFSNGNITIDAGAGNGDVVTKADTRVDFLVDGSYLYIGNLGAPTKTTHIFSGGGVVLDAETVINGETVILGNIAQQGYMENTAGFGSAVAQVTGGLIGQILDINGFTAALQSELSGVNGTNKTGDTAATQMITNQFYKAGQAGNSAVITAAGFSFRDDALGSQYGTANFVMIEPRWQAMVRMNMASGGIPWSEPAVHYQNLELLPYPGNKAWNGPTLLQLSSLQMFDIQGFAKDRASAIYASPALGAANPVTPAGNFLTLANA
jgi:hypothetical protein